MTAAVGTTAPSSPPHPSAPSRETSATDIDDPSELDRVWEGVLARAGENSFWGAVIAQFQLRAIGSGIAHIEVLAESLRSQAEQPRNRQELAGFLSSAAGRPLQVSITLASAPAPPIDSRSTPIDPSLRARAERDPIVRRAMELFNARITEVRGRPTLPDTPGRVLDSDQ